MINRAWIRNRAGVALAALSFVGFLLPPGVALASPTALRMDPSTSQTQTTPPGLPLLEMVGAARASAAVVTGGRAAISFTAKNTGPQAGSWDEIEVVLRRPDGSTLTCPAVARLTLVAGQEATFKVSSTCDAKGTWAGAVFVFTAGAWHLLGVNPAFTFNVADDTSATVPLPPLGEAATDAQVSPPVAIAQRYLGVPYLWGGADPSGFDCSGLVAYVFGQLGIGLPRTAAQQYAACTPIPLAALAPGDLVFFGSSPATIHHVGIYVGGDAMIDAPCSGAVVRYDWLHTDLYGGGRP